MIATLILLSTSTLAADADLPAWTSENNYRILLTVDPRGRKRSHSPAHIDIDFTQALAVARGARIPPTNPADAFDDSTLEVIACDADGRPRIYNPTLPGHEKHLLPHRLERFYGITRTTLHFVLPDEKSTQYAVYFDTRDAARARPPRYPGLVGNGDFFMQDHQRREIGASHMCDFADLDADGDLDLFKVTVEPFIYCYENVGGNRFEDRGRLTSGGELFVFPHHSNHRAWPVLTFADWDEDGDQDLFVTFNDGPDAGHVVRYENTTPPGGPITFTSRGRLLSRAGTPLGSRWFAAVTVVDWDGDAHLDLLITRHDHQGQLDDNVEFHRGVGTSKNIQHIELADPVILEAAGAPIRLRAGRVECADLDADGDLDLVAARQGPPLTLYRNIGTRTQPVLDKAVELPFCGGGHVGIEIADFDGDGLLDYVHGNLWESNRCGRERLFARMYKNVGTRTEPTFEPRDASSGAPYTERFQICDAIRQNTVRACDWDNDGRTDLMVGHAGGIVWWFRNRTDHLAPIFEPERRLIDDAGPSARLCVCDWNNDQRKDLLVANVRGELWLYLNEGTDAAPVLGEPTRVQADGKPIDGTHWASVLVCDYDSDGKKDVIFGMGGESDPSENIAWKPLHDNPLQDCGFLFYRNIGTDAAPVLAKPEWLQAGSQGERAFDYLRPNLGSFVDWDNDGRKDLIACEFENVVRLYRNTGPAQAKPGTVPQFADGVTLLQPWTVQMISGADITDFNRDGDLDLLTGQGHGGTGLRFYERDYLDDLANNTAPVVTAGLVQQKRAQSP